MVNKRGFASGADVGKYLAGHPQTQVTSLPNGLRVASEYIPGETATVGVWIDTGSRYENEANNGVAHFLEHMFFKGTNKRSRLQLEVEIENMGGHLNAYTSREQTVFYAKTFSKDVPQAMDILSDILQNSKIDASAVERERGVILRENDEVNNQLEEVVHDRLHQTAYRGTPLGRTILGSVDNIKKITREDILQYVSSHYTAPRMVIAGAGGVSHAELVKLAEELFGNVPSSPPNGVEPVCEPAAFTGSDIKVRFDDLPHAHIAYAFPTAGWNDSDHYAMQLIQTMLGAWDKNTSPVSGANSSSMLVANIAEGDCAESVMAFNTVYSDTGLFGVHAVTHATSASDCIYHIQNAMTSFCYNVDADALDEAKNQLKVSVLSHLDGSTPVCEEIGRQMLTYGRRLHPTEVVARIDAVSATEIRNAANRYFYDRDFAMAAIGPTFEIPDYVSMRRKTYWLRF